jgi:hypothetical protein
MCDPLRVVVVLLCVAFLSLLENHKSGRMVHCYYSSIHTITDGDDEMKMMMRDDGFETRQGTGRVY